jgi:hypothetical protein
MFVRLCLFLAHHRLFAFALITGLLLPAGFWARHTTFSSRLSDYYPSQHPHIKLYQEFTEMLKMTNTVIVTVTVREGTVFSSDVLGKIHRLTVSLIETRGVNPFEVMSLTHPRLKDIKVNSGGISILPIVQEPDQPQTPEKLGRIKTAVYTNLGIRGVYIAPDEKTALIRAGFWDGMAEPREVLSRLQTLAEQERDANTEVAFTGNLILAGWLIDAAPRSLLLLLVSAGVALVLMGQMAGFTGGVVSALFVNLFGAVWGFALLSLQGLTLDPLALIALFPLCIRGVALVIHWRSGLTGALATGSSPFAQEANRDRALERTAAALGRPLTIALCLDGIALFVLTWSDVPALQALGCLGVGWLAGLLVSLWFILPLLSTFGALPSHAGAQPWGMRLALRGAAFLRALLRLPVVSYGGIGVIVFLGLGAAIQLQAGREMPGTTLFYASHPFNRAFSLVNGKFIGVNQLIVIAQAPNEAAFRDPKALDALEAFQHYMAEDNQFGGALTITNLTKSITRMFHEDIPKWEIIPDDINSTGQVIFRIISSAATPSEVERFLSTDYHTTTVTFFYRNYSPDILDRILTRAKAFTTRQQDHIVQFRVGGGILGVLAAVHTAVEHAFWRMLGVVLLLVAIGGFFLNNSFRPLWRLLAGVFLAQGVLLSVLWLGDIDLNMYTLPAIVLSVGTVLIPLSLGLSDSIDAQFHAGGCIAIGLTIAAAAAVWLLSPLRLQAEMGVFFIALALLLTIIPLGLKRSRV